MPLAFRGPQRGTLFLYTRHPVSMSDDIKARLTDIRGVGDSIADEILRVLPDDTETAADVDVATAREEIADAVAAYDSAQYEYAEKYVRRAHTALQADGDGVDA